MTAVNQQERSFITEPLKYFLAGFIEGEGSCCVSVKKLPTARFGYVIDPEFFIYQHEKGRDILEMARTVFGTGRIYPKPGNERVLVFAIDNRRGIKERVIPFLDKYLIATSKKEEYDVFKQVIAALENKEHTTREGFAKLVELVYRLKGKGKPRKRTLNEVMDEIFRDCTPDAPAGE